MFRGDFACDPLNAVKIDKRIQDEVDRLFAEGVPDDCLTIRSRSRSISPGSR